MTVAVSVSGFRATCCCSCCRALGSWSTLSAGETTDISSRAAPATVVPQRTHRRHRTVALAHRTA